MLIFPQLASGAMVQYPFKKTRVERTVTNRSEDGVFIGFADPNSATVHWELLYQDLSTGEIQTLLDFFEKCEGSLQSFVFIDPSMNLFAFSQDQAKPVWQRNTLLRIEAGIDDPTGTSNAFALSNGASVPLGLTQTVQIPGTIVSTFSVYLRAPTEIPIEILRSDGSTLHSQTIYVTPSWNRYSLFTSFASSVSSHCDFSLIVPERGTLEVFGFQLDAQPIAGAYLATNAINGLFTESRFDADQLEVVATAPGLFRTRILIRSRGQF